MPTLHSRKYRRDDASKYLKDQHGIDRKPATLAKYASVGGGPKYVLDGRFPLYPEPELDAWAEARISPLKSSTSDTTGDETAVVSAGLRPDAQNASSVSPHTSVPPRRRGRPRKVLPETERSEENSFTANM
jgi:hypothetical protein